MTKRRTAADHVCVWIRVTCTASRTWPTTPSSRCCSSRTPPTRSTSAHPSSSRQAPPSHLYYHDKPQAMQCTLCVPELLQGRMSMQLHKQSLHPSMRYPIRVDEIDDNAPQPDRAIWILRPSLDFFCRASGGQQCTTPCACTSWLTT